MNWGGRAIEEEGGERERRICCSRSGGIERTGKEPSLDEPCGEEDALVSVDGPDSFCAGTLAVSGTWDAVTDGGDVGDTVSGADGRGCENGVHAR